MKTDESKLYYFNNKEELIEEYTTKQVEQLLQYPPYEDCFISIMPDAHPGKVTPVGFTCYITNLDKIMPMAIGGDIGCGVTVVNIESLPKKFDFKSLDVFIRDNIPTGFNNHTKISDISEKSQYEYDDLFNRLNIHSKDLHSKGLFDIGTLGGGNHFIEIEQGERTYLTVHSGSRYLGNAITEKYLDIAQKQTKLSYDKEVPRGLSWLSGEFVNKYISDVEVLSEYARLNRMEIINKILKFLKIKSHNIVFDVPHNTIIRYNNSNMITKGAVFLNTDYKTTMRMDNSFNLSRLCILPLNMRDGIAIGSITMDPLWNYCIPHGTGRKYLRTETKSHTTVNEFKKNMSGIYCSCINSSTLDESPAAYKDSNTVLDIMREHGFKIYDIAKSIYNFKAGWKG